MPIKIEKFYRRNVSGHPNLECGILNSAFGAISSKNRNYPEIDRFSVQYAFVVFGGPGTIYKRKIRNEELYTVDFLFGQGDSLAYVFNSEDGSRRFFKRNVAGVRLLKGDYIYYFDEEDKTLFMDKCRELQEEVNSNNAIPNFRARDICAGIDEVRKEAFIKWNRQ